MKTIQSKDLLQHAAFEEALRAKLDIICQAQYQAKHGKPMNEPTKGYTPPAYFLESFEIDVERTVIGVSYYWSNQSGGDTHSFVIPFKDICVE